LSGNAKRSWEVEALKGLLLIYILLGLLIAGVNFGWAPKADEQTQAVILRVWQIYENEFKTLLILVCSLLTLRITGKKHFPRLRRYNLIGLLCAAIVVHIAAPLIAGNPDLYFVGMPLPWSTGGLRLAVESSAFYQAQSAHWGARSIEMTLVFFAAIHVIVFPGTFLLGRRWQCSTLCLFNGFASEVFEPAFPLFGTRKTAGRKFLRTFAVLRWFVLAVSILLTLVWIVILIFGIRPAAMPLLETFETYKYLALELLAAMFLWCTFAGRGYCYYCPLGTVLSWIGRLVDQKIITDKSSCIGCGKCDSVCPMSIPIREKALKGEEVVDSRCVGCGHCVDACPVHTLGYSTRFLARIGRV